MRVDASLFLAELKQRLVEKTSVLELRTLLLRARCRRSIQPLSSAIYTSASREMNESSTGEGRTLAEVGHRARLIFEYIVVFEQGFYAGQQVGERAM